MRQTYDGEARNEYWPPLYRRRTLGEVVGNARRWARERIEEAKGLLTLRDEEAIQRHYIKVAFSRVSLRALAEAKFRGMAVNGASDYYIFALKKVFYSHAPLQLQETKFARLGPTEIARCLKSLHKKPGAARMLRAFLGHLLEAAKDFHPYAHRLLRRSQQLYSPDYDARRVARILVHFAESTFKRIFLLLEKEDDWVRASFVRLYLELNVPASLLMRAKWGQFVDGRFFAWLPGQRKYWHFHARRLDSEIENILCQLRKNCDLKFPSSPYLFPSNASRNGHITTYKAHWRSFALRHKLRTANLRRLVLGYQWSVKHLKRFDAAFGHLKV
ncbi:MAG TPA: hypothetical protein VMR17_14930 [Xanthobacteraceae bacterium]|nr:hypothetical protein [Xanthobacteraceae bacterium]